MEAALGSATSLLGKVFMLLSDVPVAAYVDSLELGHNSDHIKAKLIYTQGLLQIAQGMDVQSSVSALKKLLEDLSRMTDEAENLLDEVHYFQIHDKLHGTIYATTQEAGQDLGGVVRHQALHACSALRQTVDSLLQCFSCSHTQDGGDDSSVAGAPRGTINPAIDDGDTSHFDRVSTSRKIKSVLQDMQIQCDSVSDLLGKIPSSSSAVVVYRPQIGSTIIQDTLYGRRDTFEETVNRITCGPQMVSVLPIVGPGGIGKTTFAQHVYNDARTEEHFKVRVWVCVSTEFDVLKLTREILGCILATEGGGSNTVANETTNLDQLQKSIANRLKSKRFLIVLDDIWKCDGEDQWKTLLAPFTKGEVNGSMVLVTTRFPKLAQMMKTTGILELAGLESNDFFTFFEACIFGDHKPEQYEDELAGTARKIASKLKGSPLAAKTVGRLLEKNISPKHWNGVLEKHEWLNQQNPYDIMPSLRISYDYLPFDLKKYFPYFGLFPEDHRFDNSEMNRPFVAIGIANSTHQADRNYLEELVDNGFLMKEVHYGDRYYYVMHDLMHELSKSVSAQECLNISGLGFRAEAIPQSVRHLSITIEDRYDENFEEEMCKLRGRVDIANLRTLLIFRGYEERITKLLKDCFKEVNSLRVLYIVVNSPEPFLDRFSKLIHLQYLKIGSSHDDRKMSLPSTISRFYHLKFLDLDHWYGSSDLPEDFSHLENLHDFFAKSELHSNIRNVGKIKHLQRLKEFHVKKESMGFELRELGALTELKGELIIRGLEHVTTKEEATAAKLMLKRNLNELKLLWDRDQSTTDADILDALQPHSNLRVLKIANHGGTRGPSWLCLDIWLTSLETLTLKGISWSTLPPFGKLPNLKVLILKGICGTVCAAASGNRFTAVYELQFPSSRSLQALTFSGRKGLVLVPVKNGGGIQEDNLSLRRLEITECGKIFCRWPMGEAGCQTICPFPASLRELYIEHEPSMKSMSLLSNLTSLTSLSLVECRNLTVDGFNPLITVNLEELEVTGNTVGAADLLSEVARTKLMPAGYISRLKKLVVDNISGLLVAPICNLLAPALCKLEIYEDKQAENFTEEQEKALQLLTSLQKLEFSWCEGLQSLPEGLHCFSSLKDLRVTACRKIQSMPKEGFPVSLRKLWISPCSAEIDEQIEKIRRTNPDLSVRIE